MTNAWGATGRLGRRAGLLAAILAIGLGCGETEADREAPGQRGAARPDEAAVATPAGESVAVARTEPEADVGGGEAEETVATAEDARPGGPELERYTGVPAEPQRVPPRADEEPTRTGLAERPARAGQGAAELEAAPETPAQAPAAAAEPRLRLGDQEEFARTTLSGPVRSVGPGTWAVADSAGRRELRFTPELVAEIGPRLARARLEVIAARRAYPDAVLEGLVLSQGRQLLYLAEALGDRAVLRGGDRRGLSLRQIRDDLGRPAITGPDRLVYHVPVEVRVGAQTVRLAPGASAVVGLEGGRYRITVLESRYAVPSGSGLPLEEQTQHVRYVLRLVPDAPPVR